VPLQIVNSRYFHNAHHLDRTYLRGMRTTREKERDRETEREREREKKGKKHNNACSDCRMNCNGGSARRFDLKLLIAPIIRFAMRYSNGHSFTIAQRLLPLLLPPCISFHPRSNDIALLLPSPLPPSLSLSLSLFFPMLSFFLFFPFSKNISNITTRFCEAPIYESPRETPRFLPAARFNSKSSTRRQ